MGLINNLATPGALLAVCISTLQGSLHCHLVRAQPVTPMARDITTGLLFCVLAEMTVAVGILLGY